MTPEGTTYVLRWVPGSLFTPGWWVLQDIAAWRAGDPPAFPFTWDIRGESRDVNANDFAGLIATVAGYPVVLEKGSARPRRFRRRHPVWWVRPAAGGCPW